MHTSLFFKLFPPPEFMLMKYAGLDISDDAVRFIEFSSGRGRRRVEKFSSVPIPEGVVDGGNIKDENALKAILTEFEKKNHITYVKVSVPEEKAYLFQTDVPIADVYTIGHSIEFKLEENVPLTGADAIYYFDLLPTLGSSGTLRASVSVVPRVYIEPMIATLRGVGMLPVAFEVVPKAIARAVVASNVEHAVMVVHIMNRKTGVYIVSGGVVCFTSTVAWGSRLPADGKNDISVLSKEISRIYAYWMSHGAVNLMIDRLILVGHDAPVYENALRASVASSGLPVMIGNAWQNIFNLDHYIPPISMEDSLDFVVAAGLAVDF